MQISPFICTTIETFADVNMRFYFGFENITFPTVQFVHCFMWKNANRWDLHTETRILCMYTFTNKIDEIFFYHLLSEYCQTEFYIKIWNFMVLRDLFDRSFNSHWKTWIDFTWLDLTNNCTKRNTSYAASLPFYCMNFDALTLNIKPMSLQIVAWVGLNHIFSAFDSWFLLIFE